MLQLGSKSSLLRTVARNHAFKPIRQPIMGRSRNSSTITLAVEQEQAPSAETEPAKAPKGRSGANTKGSSSKQMIDTQPPRGTRDFYPDEMRFRNWLFGEFAAVSAAFGFEQFDAPVLESEELFVRKAGEEITDQLYNFEQFDAPVLESEELFVRKAGEEITDQLFNFEWNPMQKTTPGVDRVWTAEVLALAAIQMFLKRVGLTSKDVGIKVSSRKVLQSVMTQFGVPEDQFAKVCVIVDKVDKLPREKVEEELAAIGVQSDVVDGLLSAMNIRSLDDMEKLLGSNSEAIKDLQTLFKLAEGYGYSDWLVFDPSVVRGLAYYTGTVFEGFDREGNLRAIFGGGRYDKLLGTLGGEDSPMAGFGFGDAVIVELLKDKGLLPEVKQKVDDVVFVMDENLRAEASGIAMKLREAGRSVELVLEAKKMKWAFKHAEKCGASRLVLVGNKEWEKGMVSVKDLATFNQVEMAIGDLLA
eukprot:gene22505-29631_t